MSSTVSPSDSSSDLSELSSATSALSALSSASLSVTDGSTANSTANSTVALSTSAAATSTYTPQTTFAITTTFTPPASCDQAGGGLTMLKNRAYQIWLDEPVPVPGTTITSCYAPQFISSYFLQQGGLPQAAFSLLLCPDGYTTQGPYTSNYIACCPSGWDGLAPASSTPSDRPAFSGTCYTNIYNKPIRITFYDDASLKASSIFTATDSLAQAYAYPYEGFAFGVAEVASIDSSVTTTASTAASSTAAPAATATGAAATTSASSASVSLSGGAIAGVAVGSVAGAILFLFLPALLFWRRRRRDHPRNLASELDVPQYVPDPVSAEKTSPPIEMPQTQPQRWHELPQSQPERWHELHGDGSRI